MGYIIIINNLNKIISTILAILGFKLTRIGREKERLQSEFTQNGALYRCKNRRVEIKSVIDVGASDGSWSKKCMKFYPDRRYHLIEAQMEHEKALKEFAKNNENISYSIEAAGDEDGELFFDARSLFGGLALHKQTSENEIRVKSVKIDTLVKRWNLQPPYLIKLDTHGFEIPILDGASDALQNTNLIICEAYNFLIAKGSVRFYDLCWYMEEKGFLPIDLVDLTLRKKDNSLWQMDLFFVKNNRKEFEYHNYL